MSRSFRFVPPDPRGDLLSRPRLLRALVGRWEHRVTAVTAGPGLGKTTLLAQAIAENRLAPRGDDVWVGLEAPDADADQLARMVASALAPNDTDGRPDPRAVAGAVWQRSPSSVCLMLDDVHLVPEGSTGAQWLADLLEALPANGHLLLAGRGDPPMPLSRYGTQGAVLWVGEDDMRFSPDELATFAARHHLDPAQLADTGGWPAMAALVASVGGTLTGDYLWEEVLEPLGDDGREMLAVLCELGGGDDALVSAAIGRNVELAEVLRGVPLVDRSRAGWHEPHALWATARGTTLSPGNRVRIRRQASAHLTRRGRFDDAFRLLEEAQLWDDVPEVLRAACLAADRVDTFRLGRWLAACPPAVQASSAGRFTAGLHMEYSSPSHAVEPMQRARRMFRDEGDVDAELSATAHLGWLLWWEEDAGLLMSLAPRVLELAQGGSKKAKTLTVLGVAMAAELAGDDLTVLDNLGRVRPGLLDPLFDVLTPWCAALVRLSIGQAGEAAAILDRLLPAADPSMRYAVAGLRLLVAWAEGHVDDVRARTEAVMADARASGVAHALYLGTTGWTMFFAHIGDLERARQGADEGRAVVPVRSDGSLPANSVMAQASLQLAEGDEDGARATLEAAMATSGIDRGPDRHLWRHCLALSYVLVPAAREHWDGRELHGHLAQARSLARLVVAVRASQAPRALAAAELPPTETIRALLHHRLAAELAVGLAAARRREGAVLLDALGPPGRAVARRVAASPVPHAKSARSLLSTVPAPPDPPLVLAVLGPITVRRGGPDGPVADDADLRRQRIQELLAFLVTHRSTTRAKVTAALWPDLEARAAANNLGVTLSRLLRVLEPGRAPGEPAYLVRVEGQAVQLVADQHLRLDVDDFDAAIAAAAQAEADGLPSLALEHNLAAVQLYRGDLYVDLPEAAWFALDREHYRSRFVTAAVRAGQLLLGRGDADLAEAIAYRTLTSDPWSEDAYAVLIAAAIQRGDRTTARRLLERCEAMLDELGASPSPASERLRRRILGVAAA